MIISDLNLLETVEASAVVGGNGGKYTYYQNDKVKLDIYTDIDLDDNSAEAFGDAIAKGKNSFTKTYTFAYASDYYSASSSASFAAVDGKKY
ncbi:hypothetical protein [Sphaerospermopsis torques-reginae]|uniref:Uncharacterized protein n=1 Tax=Sphaerospermopsis torques-reginae ITEP-024 TaxID=984208 RepID=A0ABX8WUT5_9CYAN|nr:hypothetical protein [Sphaerospermopsis torques-reginae]QYX30182.1 hypothetical protein K2F26_14670 [Sphaerospermopsis torques-reginae ITEP-024]